MDRFRTLTPRWKAFGLATLLLFIPMSDLFAPPSGFNYNEANVPDFSLPDPLLDEGGREVDADSWRQDRRAEIQNLFQNHVYGVQPPPPPAKVASELYEDSDNALSGAARRKQIKLYLTGDKSGPSADLLIYLPPASEAPSPVFLGLNFRGNHTIADDPDITLNQNWMRPGDGVVDHRATEASRAIADSRWPVEMIVERGFAVATLYYGDIDPDTDDGFANGIHAFFPELQQRDDNFSSIAAWAWGLSRVMDYLEQDEDIDSERVAVLGHSRLGKTALWAGATDPRFAMVISNNSGCGGAALSRRRFGETVKRINTSFPHWFCRNHRLYNDNEDALPVDQHQLIALIAPRLVYVASAQEDKWADPKGEFLSLREGSPVYRLLGHEAIPADAEWPASGGVIHTEKAGYHLRSGGHDITAEDWGHFLDFAEERL
ncbi:MAG: acetylxylan esterase [Verrucomicrobiota bacterium]